VQHHRQLADLDREPLLEPRARVLELRQHALRVVAVALVVAGDERLGCGLDPHPFYVCRSIAARDAGC
jgi:hypothetical protein